MLLVLSAPSLHDEYYKDTLQKIVNFQIEYANKILSNDNVIIIVDEDTKQYYEDKVPSDVLLVDEIHDIWMRDFTTINPFNPTQFTYSWSSMSKSESKDVQNSFNDIADKLNIVRQKTNLIIDGGNIVDNYNSKLITTTRFLEDNKLTVAEGKEKLKELLHAKEVAILEPDEDILAHSDGIVSWIDDNTLLVNDYGEDKEYRDLVINELKNSFPDTKIIEVPVIFQENKPGEWEGFNSACGVNLNAVLTKNNLYVPTFGIENDEKVLGIIKANTSKNVIPISAEKVCSMGGSVRCLTWQVAGENSKKIITAARND
jgi:agmatine/peptidylarginine deiminase